MNETGSAVWFRGPSGAAFPIALEDVNHNYNLTYERIDFHPGLLKEVVEAVLADCLKVPTTDWPNAEVRLARAHALLRPITIGTGALHIYALDRLQDLVWSGSARRAVEQCRLILSQF